MVLELFADLLLQGDARIEHDAQQTDDLEVRVEVGVHPLDGVDQIGQALQRKILALHGHDHPVRCAQPVEREQRQRGRAIHQHKVVLRIDLGQGRAQALFAPLQPHKFDLSTGQFAVGTEHIKTAAGIQQFLAGDPRLFDAGRFEQHVVDRQFELALVDARAHGGVALWVQIDHEHALPELGQAGGQVDGGGGLAHPTLLIGNTKYFGHGFLFESGGQRESASFRPKPMSRVPATFSRADLIQGLARRRSAKKNVSKVAPSP